MAERERALVRMPREIKQAAFERTETNVTDEMVGVLADHYKVRFAPSGRPGGSIDLRSDEKFLLRMPSKLKDKIVMDAARRRSNLTDRICEILAEAYGVDYEPSGNRRVPFGGGKRAAARA